MTKVFQPSFFRCLLILALLVMGTQLAQAQNHTLYWVGGAGNWNSVTHWSLSSGNSGGVMASTLPTIDDDVIFDNNSGFSASNTVIINVEAYARNLRFEGTGVPPTIVGGTSYRLYIGGNLLLQPGMTFNPINLSFVNASTFTGIASITTNGVIINSNSISDTYYSWPTIIDKPGQQVVLADGFKSRVSITFTSGTFTTNGFPLEIYQFSSSGSATRNLDISNSSIKLSKRWAYDGTNCTLLAAGSDMRIEGTVDLSFQGLNTHSYNDLTLSGAMSNSVSYGTFNQVIFNGGTGAVFQYGVVTNLLHSYISTNVTNATITGEAIFENVPITAGAVRISGCTMARATFKGDAYFGWSPINNTFGDLLLSYGHSYTLANGGTQTVTGNMSMLGSKCDGYASIFSASTSSANLKVSIPTTLNHIFVSGINSNGALLTINNGANFGNNAGLLYTQSAEPSDTYYWIGGAGDWFDRSHWSSSSGGAANGCVPTPFDNAVFDDKSGFTAPSQIVTAQGMALCHSIRFEDNSNPPVFTADYLHVYGSMLLQSGMTYKVLYTYFLSGSTGNTITTNGVLIQSNNPSYRPTFVFNNAQGEWTFSDDLTMVQSSDQDRGIYFKAGTLNLNDKTITTCSFYSPATEGSRTLKLGASYLKLSRQFLYLGPTVSPNNMLEPHTSFIEIEGKSYVSNSASFNASPGSKYYHVAVFGLYNVSTSGNFIVKHLWFPVSVSSYTASINGAMQADSVTNYRDLTFTGGANVGVLEALSNTTFNGASTFGKVIFGDGKDFIMESGKTQTIGEVENLTTGCNGYMSLRSSGTGVATLKSSSSTFFLNAVNMKNISATGGGTFKAAGVDEGGNTGWGPFGQPTGKTLYWVGPAPNGGGGLWTEPTNWTQNADGTRDAGCRPTRSDNVVFNQYSGSITEANPVYVYYSNVPSYGECLNMTWDGVPGNPVLKGAMYIYGSLSLQAGMSYMANYGIAYFKSDDPNVVRTITTNGSPMPSIKFESAVGKWELTDDLDCSTGLSGINLFSGALLDTKGHNIRSYFLQGETSFGLFKLNNSQISVTQPAYSYSNKTGSWNYLGGLDAGTSHIILEAGGLFRSNNDHTFYNITIKAGSYPFVGASIIQNLRIEGGFLDFSDPWASGNVAISRTILGEAYFGQGVKTASANTFNNLTLGSGYTYTFTAGKTQTVTGNVKIDGTCWTYLQSSASGTPATLSIPATGTVKLNHSFIKDIAATGGADFSVTAEDQGGNSGWTFTPNPESTIYWVGGAGNWNDLSHWATTSGGIGGANGVCVPTQVENVVFDDFSGFTSSSLTVTITTRSMCNNIGFLGSSIIPMVVPANYNTDTLNVYGSMELQNGMNVSAPVNMMSTKLGNTIKSNGASLGALNLRSAKGGWILADDMSLDVLDFYAGNFSLGGHKVTARTAFGEYFFAPTRPEPRTLDISNGQVIINANGYLTFTYTGTNLLASGSKIVLGLANGSSGTTNSFTSKPGLIYDTIVSTNLERQYASTRLSGGFTAKRIEVYKTTSIDVGALTAQYAYLDGSIAFTSNSTIDSLIVEQRANRTITYTAGTTNTVNKLYQVSGSPCNRTKIQSSTSSPFNLNLPKPMTIDFVDVKWVNATNAMLNMERNSGNLGNNTNVTFAPASGEGVIGLGLNRTICYSSFPYTLNTDGFFPGPPARFTWLDLSKNVLGTAPTLTITKPGSYIVEVNYKDADLDPNCCIRKDTVTISSMASIPTPTFTIDRPVCHLDPVNITVTAPLGASYSYSLYREGSSDPVVFQASTAFGPLASGNYTLTVQDVDGCFSSSAQVKVSAPRLPATAADIVAAGTTICHGGSISITPSTSTIEAARNPVFRWYADAALTTQLGTGTFAAGPFVRDTAFYVTVSCDTLCENLTGTARKVNVKVAAQLVAGIAAFTPATCGYNDGTITGSATGGLAPYEYSLDGSTWLASPLFSTLPAGTYTLRVKDALGCEASIGQFIESSLNMPNDFSWSDAPESYGVAAHRLQECVYFGTMDLTKVQQVAHPSIGANTAGNDNGINNGVIPSVDGFTDLTDPAFLLKSNGDLMVTTRASNSSDKAANILAWIDFNRNGKFDLGEACAPVGLAAQTTGQDVSLVWANAAGRMKNGATYLRARISTEALSAALPADTISGGEVEDYRLDFNVYEIEKTVEVKHHPATRIADVADTLTYSLRLSNKLNTAATFDLFDYVPAYTRYIIGSAGAQATYIAAEEKIEWNGVNVPAGTSQVFTFDVLVVDYPAGDHKIPNIAYAVYQGDTISSAVACDLSEVLINPLFAGDDCALVAKNRSITITIGKNDTDSLRTVVLSQIVPTATQQGTAVINSDGWMEYTPLADFAGIDSVRYQISVPGGAAQAWVRIAVVDAANNKLCAGSTAAIGVKDISNVAFNWYTEDGTTIASNSPTATITMGQNDTVFQVGAVLFGCTTNRMPFPVAVLPKKSYSDIRVQLCAGTPREVYLTKYLDTAQYVSSVWTPLSPIAVESATGRIADVSTLTQGTYKIRYNVTNTCGISGAVLYLTVQRQATLSETDTIVFCKDFAQDISLNQILGLEVPGNWSFRSEIAAYVNKPAGTPNTGNLIFDGQSAYNDPGLPPADFGFSYHGTASRKFEFTYNLAPNSCYNVNQRKIVIIITPAML